MSSPFEAPRSDETVVEERALAEDLHAELSRARPAQFVLAGCGFLLALFCLGIGAFGLAAVVFAGAADGGIVLVGALFYGVLALTYGVPAVLIGRSALALGGAGPVADRVRASVRFQRQFWQVVLAILASMVLMYGLILGGLLLLGSQLDRQFDAIGEELERVEADR